MFAGFWKRFVAYLIDSLIVGVVAGILENIINPVVAYLIIIVFGWLYFALQESSKFQATLGKRALGIYVTDLNGNRISFGRATGRYFGKILSGLILDIGYIMAGFTARKQGLHDFLASTLVLDGRANTSYNQPFTGQNQGQNGWGQPQNPYGTTQQFGSLGTQPSTEQGGVGSSGSFGQQPQFGSTQGSASTPWGAPVYPQGQGPNGQQ